MSTVMAPAAGTRELVEEEPGRLVVEEVADGIPDRAGVGDDVDDCKKCVGVECDDAEGARDVEGIVARVELHCCTVTPS